MNRFSGTELRAEDFFVVFCFVCLFVSVDNQDIFFSEQLGQESNRLRSKVFEN